MRSPHASRPALAPGLALAVHVLGALVLVTFLAAPLVAQTAAAGPVSGDQARGLLFAPDRIEVARHQLPDVPPEEFEVLMTVARTQSYYAALAYAPGAGIMAEPTVMASNYHSPEAARAAALQQCDARRQGGARCRLVLEVRPAGWQARGLSLSADATTAAAQDYARIRGSRALAASESGGSWVIARGDSAEAQAVAACNQEAPARDCRVLLRD